MFACRGSQLAAGARKRDRPFLTFLLRLLLWSGSTDGVDVALEGDEPRRVIEVWNAAFGHEAVCG